MNTLNDLKKQVERAKGERQAVSKNIQKRKEAIKESIKTVRAAENARGLIQSVASQTQKHLEYRISELSTLAIRAIIENSEEFEVGVSFTEKRGKTEADISLKVKENLIPPKDNVGGGVTDILGTTFRFSLWSLMSPRSSPIFIMDEPLKWLKGGGMPEKGMEIISQISKKLEVQIIMVSHSPELIAGADKVIEMRSI